MDSSSLYRQAVEVLGPEGKPITLDDLPPPNTKRWVIRRKAAVVAGVRAGLISLEEACQRYTLSVEEFSTWQRMIDEFGMRGLRVTRLKHYRDSERPASVPTSFPGNRADHSSGPGALRLGRA